MAKTKKTPELRFKRFTEEWQEQKYHDAAELRRGLTYKPSDVEAFGIRVLRSSNIDEDKLTLRTDDVFVNEEAINIEYVRANDILITAANGSSRLVGKHAIIDALDGKAVHGGFMLLSRAKNPSFLNASMSSRWFNTFTQLYVAGGNGAIGNLSKTDLENQVIFLPSDQEQTQIGTFFQNLDALIALRQRKLDKLGAVKKAMLEKMFPKEGAEIPELRFKGFVGKWERRKLGELVTIKSGWSPSTFCLGNELFVKVDDLNYSLYEQNSSQAKVGKNPKLAMIKKGSVIFPKRGAAIMTNKVRILAIDGYMDTNMMALEPDELLGIFLYLYIYLTGLYKIADTSTIPQINNKHIEPYGILLPSKDEQNKIATYFQRLDSLISLQQGELDKLKNLKKACLEKMFV